jgi:hypothetical protein
MFHERYLRYIGLVLVTVSVSEMVRSFNMCSTSVDEYF